MIKNRDDVHDAALAAYLGSGDDKSGRKSAVIQGTGTGKTKLAVSVALHYYRYYGPNLKILWITNSTKLKSEDTPDDFAKWGARNIWDQNVTAECYQTAYKWEDTKWDLVIADEGDFALTEEYIKFFYNNSYKNLLFLTATVREDKQLLLDEIATTCFTYSTQQAQEDGVLNKSSFTIVEFDLERKQREIVVEYKKGGAKKSFKQTENEAYVYIEKALGMLYGDQKKLQRDLFKAQMHNKPQSDIDELENKLVITKTKINRNVLKRKEFLWNLASSVRVTHGLLKHILVGPGKEKNKALVFAARTAQADKLCRNTYHGKNSKDSEVVNNLNKGVVRAIAVVQSMNRGANLVGVNHIIKESYNGSYVDFQQQHGRGTRLDPSATMHFWILRPYYWTQVMKKQSDGTSSPVWVRRKTQAVVWSEEMTKDFDLNNAKHIILK